jgi:2-polyprenyl-3-methyl-5-hydroxy-6-metoxy-1,4-benzoquinol methylase
MINDVQPFDRETAARIARAFRPARWHGNRYDYYYTLAKLRSDPLYPGVLAALRGCDAPLMDLGCGLGLLAHTLRGDGQRQPYAGVDIDAGKIARAARIAERAGLHDARFTTADLVQALPDHHGSVAILDVLHYLPDEAQHAMLDAAAAMLVPGARLVIRSGLGDDSGRHRTTRAADWFGHLAGWMQTNPRRYPSRAFLEQRLHAAGLESSFQPLYGKTPFNNWLIVATRT